MSPFTPPNSSAPSHLRVPVRESPSVTLSRCISVLGWPPSTDGSGVLLHSPLANAQPTEGTSGAGKSPTQGTRPSAR